LSQRLRQTTAAEPQQRNNHAPASTRARIERAFRESTAAGVQAAHGGSWPPAARAVPAWFGPGDFDLALRGLLGDGAPLSAPSIARLKAGWQAEYELWKSRAVDDLEVVYLWVDGVYVKAGLEKEKAAILVVLAALRNGQKVILAVESGYRESTESWAAILRDLKRRGLQAPKLVIGDGHLGIWAALAAVFPEAAEQRCWNHRILNVLDKLPLKRQAEARSLLTKIPYAETREEAERHKRMFQAWCAKHGHAEVGRALDRDWERMVTFYAFPREHWKHLRTSNPVESP